ncbi:uncharacterized protein LOC120837621 [Ixodes scapularis]|uniref:uncharacterized protein LOC120837621 n=1 Tax=Ixodes scapularis TaxID=6945 RepID=UPI001C381D47|nr:uncharacterized protein LOC120837621 [Ixodes scapularis]
MGLVHGPPEAPSPSHGFLGLFAEVDDETHLGHGIMVATSKLKYILGARGDSMFCKEATKVVFGAANLQRRSVTGQACRRLKGSVAKRALTPNKLAAVGNAFQLYITQTSSDKSPKKRRVLMNKYIGEQLHDINRKLEF